MNKKIKQLIEDVCGLWACPRSELAGFTVRELLEESEAPGVVIFWGCWNSAELDFVPVG